MMFFVGLHQPSDAHHFSRCFISVNRLWDRQSNFDVGDWILDSGAFTEITRYGGYRRSVESYAAQIRRWRSCGRLLAAVSQDYMCEPFVLSKTGMSVAEHQRLTIERYDRLLACDSGAYIMPVLQGYKPGDYASHVRQYGARLKHGMWTGVGSVCKRNTDPAAIAFILQQIKAERPDLRLHGFGAKTTALRRQGIRALLWSADSMAWSYHARKNGRSGNDWREAAAFAQSIIHRERPLSDLPMWQYITKESI